MKTKERILIFQIGSLGDTVISMPCYREITRRHPGAERYLLTNYPIGKKMVQAEALLAPCGLIHGSIEYPMPLRGIRNIRHLYRRIKNLRIDVLYYLSAERHVVNLVRHYAFFKASGIADIRGVPWSRDKRYPRSIVAGRLWESEASRLLRTIGAQSEVEQPKIVDRSLDLSSEERRVVDNLVGEVPGLERFVAISVGGKVPINDWGIGNWSGLLARITARYPTLGAVFVGSADERARNEELAQAWRGPKLNSCGRLTPRETAALIERAELFLGHDTGTLHLAAAVGTSIIGVYSARNVPGKWFSDRPGDRFFYNQTPCFGCELEIPRECPNGLDCMTSHSQDEILSAAAEMLART